MIGTVLLESLTVALILLTSSLWQIYFLAFLASTIQVVKTNTRQAAIPDVIGKRLYSRAVAVSIMSIQAIDTAGVALAGALIAITGPKVAMGIDVFTFVINAGLLALVYFPQPQQSESQNLTIWQDMRSGFNFIRANAPLKFVITMLTLRGLTMIGIIPLFVDFIETDLKAGPFEFGLLSAAASLGYVLASFFTIKLEKKITPFQILVWGSAFSGLFLIPFFTVRVFAILLLLRFMSALMYGSGNLVANVQIVNLAPSEVRGRVSSTSWSLIKLSQVVSSASLGFIAAGFGTPFVIASAGIFLFGGSILALLLVKPSVKNLLSTTSIITPKK